MATPSRQTEILKLIFVQFVLLLPLFAWNQLLISWLDRKFPKRRQHTLGLILYAVIATVVAVVLLTLLPLRVPGIAVDVDPTDFEEAESADLELNGTSELATPL